MICGGELIEWSAFDHHDAPGSDLVSAAEVWTDA